MPLIDEELRTESPEDFSARKLAQWERIQGRTAQDHPDHVEGIQFARAGEQRTQFMLTCSTHDGVFYESVVFGQFPHRVREAYGSKQKPRYREADDAKKPVDKRGIDLSDAEIDQVLARWAQRKSCFDLDFVAAVWGPGNTRHVKDAKPVKPGKTPRPNVR